MSDSGHGNKNGTPSMSQESEAGESTNDTFESDPSEPRAITFSEVKDACRVMTSGVNRSMCIKSKVGPLVGMDELWINLAYEQLSGSVKERAARYVICRLDDSRKRTGIVTASSGCFAKALCHQGYMENCPVVVFMPDGTPMSTIDFCNKLKGTVIVEGKNLEESKQKALSKEKGVLYVDAHDHPDVIAALGTVAIETLQEVCQPDVIIVPAGGGGLLAGTSVVSKHASPDTKFYAAESEKSPAWSSAIAAGKPVCSAGDRFFRPIGLNSFKTAKNLVDECIVVEEKWIAAAMLLFMENDKIVLAAETCVGLAAILASGCQFFCGKRIVCILPSANVEAPFFAASIDRGLVVLGRLVKVIVTVKDEPTALPQLVVHLNYLNSKIRSVSQERAFLLEDLDTVSITCICETDGLNHVQKIYAELSRTYGAKFRLETHQVASVCSADRCCE